MAKYLDLNGLDHLVDKLDARYPLRSEVNVRTKTVIYNTVTQCFVLQDKGTLYSKPIIFIGTANKIQVGDIIRVYFRGWDGGTGSFIYTTDSMIEFEIWDPSGNGTGCSGDGSTFLCQGSCYALLNVHCHSNNASSTNNIIVSGYPLTDSDFTDASEVWITRVERYR